METFADLIKIILEILGIILLLAVIVLMCDDKRRGNRRQKQIEAIHDVIAKRGDREFYPVTGAPEDTILPVRGSDLAAGYDFFAPCDILIPAHGKSELIFFNVKARMADDDFLYMRIRSGLGTKHEIMLETSGVIDADYYNNPTTDGNIATVFRNHGDKDYTILKGERCCQGIFMKYLKVRSDKSLGARRGGYGSTGK